MQYPINASIVADSVSPMGNRLTTFQLSYPRYLHAEILTHRVFSRNAQSSRAVPVDKMIQFNSDPVVPYVYGKNNAGMSSKEEVSGWRLAATKLIWKYAATGAFTISKLLSKLGLHKQWANRITEPFSTITVIITATEWDNFFWLRDDPDAAQPEIVALARLMKDKLDQSLPVQLEKGQWHLPYIHTVTTASKQWYYDSDGNSLNISEALKISASCCAQVSYRKLNESKEKAIEIFTKLFSGPKPHMSPTEHQGCVMENERINYEQSMLNMGLPKFEIGVSHVDRKGNYWSGNLKGFIQYRKLLEVQE